MSDLTTGLRSHWEMTDWGSTVQDVGENPKPLYVYGYVSEITDQLERYRRALAPPDFLYMYTVSPLDTYADATIAFWIKSAADSSGYVGMFETSSGYADVYYDGNTTTFYNNFNSYSDSFSVSLTANKWYHVAIVLDQSAYNVKTYLNGALVRNDTDIYQPGITTDLWYIGRANGNSRFANGSFSDFRIYNRTLTEREIWCLYTGAYKTSKSGSWSFMSSLGIQHYYDMRTGTTENPDSGYLDQVGSNNLTAQNSAGGSYTDRFGLSGACNGAITANSTEAWLFGSPVTYNPITIGIWHYTGNTTHGRSLCGSRYDGGYWSGYFHMYLSYQFTYWGESDNYEHHWGSGGNFSTYSWNFFVVAKTGSTARFFTNGNYYMQRTDSFQNGTSNATSLLAVGSGNLDATTSCGGAIGEIFIFNTYVSDANVYNLYQLTKNRYVNDYGVFARSGSQCLHC